MKKLIACFFGFTLSAVLCCPSALADTFDFSFAGSSATGSGTITAQPTLTPGVFLMTDLAGTTNGLAINALLPPGTYPLPTSQANDNLLFYPGTMAYLDLQGFSYVLSDGTDVNIYFSTLGTLYVFFSDTGSAPLDSFSVIQTVTPTVTPEPASLALLATGALGAVGVFRRRLAI